MVSDTTNCGVILTAGSDYALGQASARHVSNCTDPRCTEPTPAELKMAEVLRREQGWH